MIWEGEGTVFDSNDRRKLRDGSPCMLSWLLYTSLNKNVAEYVKENWQSMSLLSGSYLNVHVYTVADSSLSFNDGAIGRVLDMGLQDLPCFVLFDSFENAEEIAIFRLRNAADAASITEEIGFLFDTVRRNFHLPANFLADGSQSSKETLIHARRHCIATLRPKTRVRRVREILARMGMDLAKLSTGFARAGM